MVINEQSVFPYTQDLIVESQHFTCEQAFSILTPYLTPERKTKMDAVVTGRSYQVATVLEDVDDFGNRNAVMRTAEGLGLQELHLIRGGQMKRGSRVSQGAEKWLDLHRWQKTSDCLSFLKKRGRKIYASTLNARSKPLYDLDLSVPCAFVLGNEKEGVSESLQKAADECFMIPMQGFVQSFNISVAGAITLAYASRQSLSLLTPEQQQRLKLEFCLRHINQAESLLLQAEGCGIAGSE